MEYCKIMNSCLIKLLLASHLFVEALKDGMKVILSGKGSRHLVSGSDVTLILRPMSLTHLHRFRWGREQ